MPLRPMTEQEKLDIEVGKMMRRVAAQPKVRRQLYQTLKAVDPNVRWPDQEMQDFKEQFYATERAKAEKLAADKAKAEMEEQRSGLVKRFDEVHVKKIEKLMEKHGIYDYDLGARLYAAEAPPPDATTDYSSRNRWTMPTDKELIDNPSKWANEMAHKVIGEFRSQRGLPGR